MTTAGVRAGADGAWPVDHAGQGLPGGAPQEQALHGLHLRHPGHLSLHDRSLRLWLFRRNEGNQVLLAHLLCCPVPVVDHPDGGGGPRVRLQGAGPGPPPLPSPRCSGR